MVQKDTESKTQELPHEPLSNTDIFRLAGIRSDEQGELLRLAFDTAKAHLSANEVRVLVSRGELHYSKPLPDYQTRAKAIDQAMELCGLSKKDVSRVQVQVNILLPSFMRSPTIEAPPPTFELAHTPKEGGGGEKSVTPDPRDYPPTIGPVSGSETSPQDSVKD